MDSSSKSKIAILTSGSDSQGMNAAIRAIVRACLKFDLEIYLVKEGYHGLTAADFQLDYQVEVEDHIKQTSWFDVSGILQRGGTVIGSVSCPKFYTREGRKLAVKNLLYLGISNLCVIGGVDTLTAASKLKSEWNLFLDEFVTEKKFSHDYIMSFKNRFKVVGLVGSIENNFCGTDMTIGVDSALHRIMESIDTITTTACSHRRIFICEITGKICGYLALMAALVSNAEYCFLPETPPPKDWREEIKNKLSKSKEVFKNRAGIIIVSEGAIDFEGNHISCEDIQDCLKDFYDTRITKLGHVQRGGNTGFYDRLIATRMGVEAAKIFATDHKISANLAQVIVTQGNKILAKDLDTLVKLTEEATLRLKNKEYQQVLENRGGNYLKWWKTFKKISKLSNYDLHLEEQKNLPVEYVAFMAIGAPCAGMNATLKWSIQHLLTFKSDKKVKYKALVIFDGFEGLLNNSVEEWDIRIMSNLHCEGGIVIGSNKTHPSIDQIGAIYNQFKKWKISKLVVIGGWEAYSSMDYLRQNQAKLPENFKSIVIPATIAGNIPLSDTVIGADTALNSICQSCDRIKLSASGSRRRVFIVEVMGQKSGYLATLAGLATGADASFIYEIPIKLENLVANVSRLKTKMLGPIKRGFVIVADGANENYTSDFFKRLYTEEGRGIFDCRMSVLGHLQQGGRPSPFDRKLAIKKGEIAIDFLLSNVDADQETQLDFSHGIVCLTDSGFKVNNVADLKDHANLKDQIPKHNWWINEIRDVHMLLSDCRDIDLMKTDRIYSEHYAYRRKSSVRM